MPEPLKPSIMQDFRDAIGVNSAPSSFDISQPLTPVALVGGNIGFPQPRSNQRLLSFTVWANTLSGGSTQVCTPDATTNYYFVGAVVQVPATGTVGIADLNTGTQTLANGNTTDIHFIQGASTTPVFPSLPRKVINGIRVYRNNTAASDVTCIVYYIEEKLLY